VVHLLLEEMLVSGGPRAAPPSSLHASPLFRVVSPPSRPHHEEQEGVEEEMGLATHDAPLPRESMVTNTRFMAIQVTAQCRQT
jgi:hypothetical protein